MKEESVYRNFFSLLRFSIGTSQSINKIDNWIQIYNIAEKHSLIGLLFQGIEKLPLDNVPDIDSLMEWAGQTEYIKEQNRKVNRRSKELSEIFSNGGFHSCLLKGQGNALYYPNPLLRQSGDIDLWVDGNRQNIIDFIKSLGVDIHHIHLVHATADFFDDVVVEIHFQPSWMYNPISERRLLRFFKIQSDIQFSLFDQSVGFTHPNDIFNIVYNLIHINRHIFDEGIGLRQIIDFYYILINTQKESRIEAVKIITSFHLVSFASSLMYVMQRTLHINEELLLFQPNEKLGKLLLLDIMNGGNFGKYGKYARNTTSEQRWKRGIQNMKRNVLFITSYPEEVLWIPFFKLWHWCWRKCHRYL